MLGEFVNHIWQMPVLGASWRSCQLISQVGCGAGSHGNTTSDAPTTRSWGKGVALEQIFLSVASPVLLLTSLWYYVPCLGLAMGSLVQLDGPGGQGTRWGEELHVPASSSTCLGHQDEMLLTAGLCRSSNMRPWALLCSWVLQLLCAGTHLSAGLH